MNACVTRKQWSIGTHYLGHDVRGASTAILQNQSRIGAFHLTDLNPLVSKDKLSKDNGRSQV
jgi:hypothetical protein